MHLTIDEAGTRLGLGRSSVVRALQSGQITGRKRHSCGGLCGKPLECKQGAWEIDAASVSALISPARTVAATAT